MSNVKFKIVFCEFFRASAPSYELKLRGESGTHTHQIGFPKYFATFRIPMAGLMCYCLWDPGPHNLAKVNVTDSSGFSCCRIFVFERLPSIDNKHSHDESDAT